jgi:hypothetical protein
MLIQYYSRTISILFASLPWLQWLLYLQHRTRAISMKYIIRDDHRLLPWHGRPTVSIHRRALIRPDILQKQKPLLHILGERGGETTVRGVSSLKLQKKKRFPSRHINDGGAAPCPVDCSAFVLIKTPNDIKFCELVE